MNGGVIAVVGALRRVAEMTNFSPSSTNGWGGAIRLSEVTGAKKSGLLAHSHEPLHALHKPEGSSAHTPSLRWDMEIISDLAPVMLCPWEALGEQRRVLGTLGTQQNMNYVVLNTFYLLSIWHQLSHWISAPTLWSEDCFKPSLRMRRLKP